MRLWMSGDNGLRPGQQMQTTRPAGGGDGSKGVTDGAGSKKGSQGLPEGVGCTTNSYGSDSHGRQSKDQAKKC